MYNIPVFDSNTVVEPAAVVVKSFNTLITIPTMLCPNRSYCLTGVAYVIYGIVYVIEVTPRGRIANLK